MTKLLTTLLLSVALISGCASVNVIQPVAMQNARNSDALLQNLQVFFSAEEPFFVAALQSQLIDGYREIIRQVQDKDNPNNTTVNAITDFYTSEADGLQKKVKDLTSESKENEKQRYYNERPLTAEVAFAGMLPRVAASKWIAFEAIRRETITSEEKFLLYKKLFRELSVIEKKEQAVKDLVKAYGDRKTVILRQGTNSKNIADQLASASNASYDASKFLTGVLENNELLSGIGGYVLKSTNDPDRRKAADDLLKAIQDGKK